MSPRPYRLGQRQAAIDETRARVIAAARELLVSADPGKFSIDAVAQHADVSRATVYYQFRSKAGLLEALFDSLGASGGMAGLADAFRRDDPLAALDEYIMVFGRFWGSDQVLHRRLRGLAALDPDLGEALRVRQEWRRRGAATLITRLTTELGAPPATRQRDATDLLFTVTSFETFDTLAGAGTPQAAVSLIQHLAHAALTLPVFPGIIQSD
ncbi:MAG TPA: TetR/AcrR family transcriptional regulator [Streptosporangiaceae bacterium]|jgi:AcrR family transcriptional regulator|nr:TetR/AcrR family transcriptional regulator [Streptosporangiaceae bacterium]